MKLVSRSAPYRYLLAMLALVTALPLAAHPGAQTRIARLDGLILSHPQNQALYLQRGGLYSHLEQWDSALRDLETARDLGDPRVAGFELGLFYYRREDYTRATAQFSHFLDLHPDHPETLLYRARTAQAAGHTDRALIDYRRHFQVLAQPHPGDFIAAAQLLAEPPTGNTTAALDLLDQGMARLGQQAQLQRYAIELELQRDNLSGALDRGRALQDAIGDGAQWQLEMAQLLLLAGRPEQAANLLEQARVELEALKPTPARLALLAQIERLQSS